MNVELRLGARVRWAAHGRNFKTERLLEHGISSQVRRFQASGRAPMIEFKWQAERESCILNPIEECAPNIVIRHRWGGSGNDERGDSGRAQADGAYPRRSEAYLGVLEPRISANPLADPALRLFGRFCRDRARVGVRIARLRVP